MSRAAGSTPGCLPDSLALRLTAWCCCAAEGGAARTTYMFAYTDAHPSRPTFEKVLDRWVRVHVLVQVLARWAVRVLARAAAPTEACL